MLRVVPALAPLIVSALSMAAGCVGGDEVPGHDAAPPADATHDAAPGVVRVPRRLLEAPLLFGGAVIAVSDHQSESYGELKLDYVAPINARVAVLPTTEGRSVQVVGCLEACGDEPPTDGIFALPIHGEDDDALLIDLAPFGDQMNVTSVTVGAGEHVLDTTTQLVAVTDDALLFDTTSLMEGEAGGPAVELVVRWYLLAEARLDPGMVPRPVHTRVGYFENWRQRQSLITRWPITRGPIYYYIVNVPGEHREPFTRAFADWNAVFRDVIGFDLLSYEFIEPGDPRAAELVPGDPRYNVVYWDTDNRASYGGTGPSFANPRDGQIFAATVLLQGPAIVELYQEWFSVAEAARRAVSSTEKREAAHRRRLLARRVARMRMPRRVRVGIGPVQLQPATGDGACAGPFEIDIAFDDPPPGQTFDSYMRGYWRELVAHELGHTLGLSHNFLGSLADDGGPLATSSVMEYVWRGRRHESRVGPYDAAAIAYGYGGVPPAVGLRYCTNHNRPSPMLPHKSAECSSTDAGPDPFAFFRDARVRRAVAFGIGQDRPAPGQPPVWQYEELREPLLLGVAGMAYYATSAEGSAWTWVRFFADPDRPTDPVDIAAYVLDEITAALCEPAIAAHIEASHAANAPAGITAAQTWRALLTDARAALAELGLEPELCSPSELLSFEF